MNYRHILLIDDDEDDHEIFITALVSLFPEIRYTIALNGSLAFALLNNRQVDPDLIFVDLNMPVMDGREFLKQIRSSKDFISIPVIILSTSSNPKTISEMMDLGATQFITKPDKLQRLKNILSDIIL